MALEDVKTAIKVLKLLHVKPPTLPKPPSKPMPTIVIKIAEVTVALSDDPFEIRLGNNYELLQDELSEQQQRERVLSTRIAQSQGQALSEERIAELYRSLQEKGAQIYIQRSKDMQSELRTELFTVRLENILLVAMDDEQLCQNADIQEHLKSLNPDAPYPTKGVDYSLLVHRKVAFSFESLSLGLRDYPHPLLFCSDASLVGSVTLAEVRAPPTGVRSSAVTLGRHTMTIAKGMTPIKIYHDLKLGCGNLDVSFGACYEPVLAQVCSSNCCYSSLTLHSWVSVLIFLHQQQQTLVRRFPGLTSYGCSAMDRLAWWQKRSRLNF